MTYIELQVEEFSKDSVEKFWELQLESGFREISLDINTEIGSIISTESDWHKKQNLPAMGVRFNVISLASRWGDLANSNLPDKEYESLVESEAGEAMREILSLCPQTILILKSTIDGIESN